MDDEDLVDSRLHPWPESPSSKVDVSAVYQTGNREMRINRLLFAIPLLGLACGTGPAGAPGIQTPGPTPSPADEADAVGPRVPDAVFRYAVISDSILGDPAVVALVAPYRNRMGEEIRRVIGEAAVPLAEAVPEGTLGNFAADAMLWAARRETSQDVHMAMTNNGGLRVPIAPGPITVGQMFELMPFENMLAILTLTGNQVQAFADELAARRGQPIAGFSFRIETEGQDRVARGILVDGEPLDPQGQYRMVTNDYLASGGEGFQTLVSPISREDLSVLLRDAFIGYVQEKKVIRAEIEGRITGGIGR